MSNQNEKNINQLKESGLSIALNKQHTKFANGFDRPSLLLNLEPRMMFDGAALAEASDIADSEENQQYTEVSTTNTEQQVEDIADSLEVEDELGVQMSASFDGFALPDANDTNLQATESVAPISADIEAELDSQEQELNSESVEDIDSEDEVDETEEVVIEEKPIKRVVFIDTSVANYDELLDSVITEIQPESEDKVASYDFLSNATVITDSSDASTGDLSTAPPVNSTETTTDEELIDSGYTQNEDGAIIIDGVAIYLLDPEADQVEEITSILDGYTDLH